MSTNADLARIFDEMASILEITGANAFRVNSYARVARVLRDLTTDVASLADTKSKLTALEGIGDSSAQKIMEFVKTGEIANHRKLVASIPGGLLEVVSIPGVGPKTARVLWEQGGVTDLASLRKAIEDGSLESLPRMGKRSLEKIRKAMEFVAQGDDRVRVGKALPLAEMMVERLQAVDPDARVVYAGSLRRGRETIGDVDLLAAGVKTDAIAKAFLEQPEVTDVLVAGDTKCSVRIDAGLQVDLRLVDAASFGAALMYFSGSKAHNVALRERAIKRGLRLNEYGLFPEDGESDETPQARGVTPIAAETEEAIYAALDLPWIPPELREDRGELSKPVPALIDLDDIGSELHAHTVASDGRLTIDQLAEGARARGFHTIAVTDHSQSSTLAGGLSPDDLRAHIDRVREADGRIDGITILAGSEVDILVDGRLDYEDDLLAELDVVVASPHASLGQEGDEATRRLIAAATHPLVHVIGHPTGRVIGRRRGLEPDIEAVIAAAVESNTALEINANPMRLDLRDTHVRAAVEAGALIAIDTDTHHLRDFDHLRYGVMTGRRGALTAERCVNAWTAERLHAWLRSKR